MKNTFKTLAVALAAAFIALTFSNDAVAATKATKQDGKIKISAKKENELLKAELDSLRTELAKYRMELRRTDSIANELINLYEGGKASTADMVVPIEYTSENKLYSWSDIYKFFRKSTRGNMNEKVYIHAWVDYCGFNEGNDYGFSLINNDGISEKVREFKGVFLVGPNGIVEDSDNKVTYYLANGTDTGDGSVTPIAFVEKTHIIT
jgi:hypothetical protein